MGRRRWAIKPSWRSPQGHASARPRDGLVPSTLHPRVPPPSPSCPAPCPTLASPAAASLPAGHGPLKASPGTWKSFLDSSGHPDRSVKEAQPLSSESERAGHPAGSVVEMDLGCLALEDGQRVVWPGVAGGHKGTSHGRGQNEHAPRPPPRSDASSFRSSALAMCSSV